MSEQEQKAGEAPRTVRVRIAVAMDAEGHWAACGWGTGEKLGMSSAETMANARAMMTDFGGVEHWIEADVPLPGRQTVRGEVVQ